jgi:CO dehydrogenase/acetyl-CoA synthase beta subunit
MWYNNNCKEEGYLPNQKGLIMKFVITRTSSDNYIGIKNFSTVEELVNFMRKQKHPLIIGWNFAFNEDTDIIQESCSHDVDAHEIAATPYNIEIYDDYRE